MPIWRVTGRGPDMASSPRRILITGASGFVGRHLIPAMAAAFPEAAILTPGFDLADAAAVADAVQAASPDSCVHLAALSTLAQAREDEDRAWRVNLHGTLHLAKALLRHAPMCQLVFASSAETYGGTFRRGIPVDEDAPLAPLNLYAVTKAAADLALGGMVEQGLRVVRVRPFNHTGRGQPPQLVVAAFARQVALIAAGRQEPVIHTGNLDPRRDFLDARDVCAAYIACVARRDALEPGTILNIASGVPRRIGDILEDLKALAGIAAETRVDPARARATDMRVAHGDASRARTLLGWAPTTPWHETLREVMEDWLHRAGTGADPG